MSDNRPLSETGNVSVNGQIMVASLFAAYVGTVLALMFDMTVRLTTGVDASMCGPGSELGMSLCQAGEAILAYALCFLWALLGLPFALVLAIPSGLFLGRLSLRFERRFAEPVLRNLQYSIASAWGALLAVALLLLDGEKPNPFVLIGAFTGAVGVFAFRRQRYLSRL